MTATSLVILALAIVLTAIPYVVVLLLCRIRQDGPQRDGTEGAGGVSGGVSRRGSAGSESAWSPEVLSSSTRALDTDEDRHSVSR